MTTRPSDRLESLRAHLATRPVGEPIINTQRRVGDLIDPVRETEDTLNQVCRILHNTDDHHTIVEDLLELLPLPLLSARIRDYQPDDDTDGEHLHRLAVETLRLERERDTAQADCRALQVRLAAVEGERDAARARLADTTRAPAGALDVLQRLDFTDDGPDK